MSNNRLVFVYNANSGILNAALHGLHKMLSPSTYECSLCAITYGAVSMRKEWKHFIQEIPLKVDFLHSDEWFQESGRKDVLPAVFHISDEGTSTVLTKSELDEMTLEELMTSLRQWLQTIE